MPALAGISCCDDDAPAQAGRNEGGAITRRGIAGSEVRSDNLSVTTSHSGTSGTAALATLTPKLGRSA